MTANVQQELLVEVVNRRLICENQKFHVYFDHIVDHAGYEVPNYLVIAPKLQTGNLVTGVGILPIINGQVGLIRIYRPALRDYSWEIPHGFVDDGEMDYAAAIRELMEETGLTVNEISSLGFMTPDSGVLAGRVHLYLAEQCVQTGHKEGELGIRAFTFFSIAEFECMLQLSEIQDSFTLAAWCRYRLLKAEI